MANPLQQLGPASLYELAQTLKVVSRETQISAHSVQQIVGASRSTAVCDYLRGLFVHNWTGMQICALLEAIAEAKVQQPQSEDLLDLVLSGPEVAGVPTRDTAAVVYTLISEAQSEVLLIGYAVHNARMLFEPLATRMNSHPELKVRFCLNITRSHHDNSQESVIVKRFGEEFCRKHWPWSRRPTIFYDPRSLAFAAEGKTSLHAKCVVIDKRIALVTSANFTEAAHHRNLEAGVILRHEPSVVRLWTYFDSLCSSMFNQCVLD